jgi:hypothetical protein
VAVGTTYVGGARAVTEQKTHHIEKRKNQDPKTIRRPILCFDDQGLVEGSPNEKLPLLIRVIITNHEVSSILVDQGSSCDIMYEELFTKLQVKDENVQPYLVGLLATLDGSLTQPPGFVTLPTTFKNKLDPVSRRTIQVKFLIIPYELRYNCILGRTNLNSLGALPSTVHLK